MRKSLQKQQGYLLISAIALIVVVAFLAASVSYIAVTHTEATINQIDSEQAFYIAEAGLARAKFKLFTTDPTQRIDCDAVSGDAALTNVSFGGGQFTVTSSISQPSPPPTLSAHINAVTTVIPVTSLAGLTSGGRVMLDKELVDYTSGTSDSLSCGGSPPCLVGVTRGTGGTNNVAHQSGTAVSQYECEITSKGAVPSFATPVAQRHVAALLVQLGDGWIVGTKKLGEFFARWNGAFWSRIPVTSSVPDVDLNAIASLSNEDAWSVGDRSSGNALMLHWDGSNWSRVYPVGVSNENLYGISCLSGQDCWAVGNKRTFAFWNGTTWAPGNVKTNGNINSGQVPNKQINAVSCSATNDCWAVGVFDSSQSLFVFWDGAQWKRKLPAVSVPAVNFNGVSCTASNDCWAVGNKSGGDAVIAHWDGSTWARVYPAGGPYASDLNAVKCVNGSDCWAVGQSGTVLHYNGASWTSVASSATRDLNAVDCNATDNCWAVGASTEIIRWQGSSWSLVPAATLGSNTLKAVAAITGTISTKEFNYWQEI